MTRSSLVTLRSDETGSYEVEVFEAETPKAIVLCATGFGMNRYDGSNLFGDIAEKLSDYTVVLVELHDSLPVGLTVNPLSRQIERFNKLLSDYSQADIPVVLVGHSMGCLVISKSDALRNHTVFLAPAVRDITKTLKNTLLSREGTSEDADGTMHAKRSDGTTSIVPAKFWQEASLLNIASLYKEATARIQINVVIAGEDQILKAETSDLQSIPFQSITSISWADHDFSGSGRSTLLEELHKLLDIASQKES